MEGAGQCQQDGRSDLLFLIGESAMLLPSWCEMLP
jgi:hypothetical protein